MVTSMRVIGKIIKLMVKEYFGTYTVINMKVGGKETKPTAMVNIHIATVPPMKETGKTICNTVKA